MKLNSLTRILLTTFVALCSVTPGHAQTYSQDFENVDSSYFQPINQQNAVGSSIAVVSTRSHGGKKSAELAFKFSGNGFIDVTTAQGGSVASGPGKVHFTMWIHGSGSTELSDIGLLLLDSGNETFLYPLGDVAAKALSSGDWTEVSADIDVTKFVGHWGQKSTGVIQYPLKFFGFGFGRGKTEAGEGTVALDDLAFVGPGTSAPSKSAGPLQIILQNVASFPGLPGDFYPLGSTVKVRVALSNLTTGINPAVDWTATDLRGKVVAQRPPGGASKDASIIEFPAATPGIIYLTATARDSAGTALATAETRCAILAPPSGISAPDHNVVPIRYGVNASLDNLPHDEAEQTASLITALGFQSVRTGVTWTHLEAVQNVWEWADYDRSFSIFAEHGITPCVLLSYSTQWASTGDHNAKDWRDWGFAPPQPQEYAHYAQEVARRYGKFTHYWEIWNEADNDFWRGSVTQYAALFDAASMAIKQVQPDAQVMNSGFSEVRFRPTFIPDFMSDVHAKPDVMAYHSHGPLGNLLRADANVDMARQAAGWRMPKWMNESGFWSSPGNSEYEQAVALVQKMSYAPVLGDSAYFWYDLRDNGVDPSNAEDNFGLVRNDYSPKASALAAYNLINTLGGLHFVRRIPVPGAPSASAILYSDGKRPRTVLVAWTPDPGAVPITCELPGPTRQADIMGVTQQVVRSHGLANFVLTTEPTYIEFDGTPSSFVMEPGVLSFDKKLSSVPGESAKLSVTVRNPFDTAMPSVVRFSAPRDWSVTPSLLRYSVPARGAKVFNVAVSSTAANAAAAIMPVQLSAEMLPNDVDGRIDLRPATLVWRVTDIVTLGQFDTTAPPTISLTQSNIVSLYEATPMEKLHFHGDADLSAGITLTGTAQGLRLSAVVHDDVFSQNEPLGQEWQGDSMQFAIVLPNGEHYEWIAALRTDGPMVDLEMAPPGIALGRVSIPVRIRRDETLRETLYDIIVPTGLPGGRALPSQFAFDVLVNDNDGDGRKGWVEWTPGIGRTKDPAEYHEIVVR